MSITSDDQLEKITKELNIPLNGIYIINDLPKKYIKGSYIYNLNGQTHWVASFNNEYFDSIGEEPPIEVIKFAKIKSFNKKQIQPVNENWCGIYCICYLWFRNNGYSLNDFLNNFDKLNLITY